MHSPAKTKPRPITILSVARKAKVGLGTASRVLSGSRHVSEAARKAVLKAVEVLGYRKNQHARALRAGSVPCAVFLCCNRSISTTLHGAVLEAAALRLHDLGWQTVLLRWDPPANPEGPPAILSRMGMDVLIVAGRTSPAILMSCSQLGVPVILSGLAFEPSETPVFCDKVAVNDMKAFKVAMEHFLSLGHRRIGIVTDPSLPWSFRYLSWWQRECKHRGLPCLPPPSLQSKGPDEFSRLGYLSTEEYLGRRERPTALMVADDLMLLGTLRACAAHGVQVPSDLSVIGLGAYPIMKFLGNPCSRVSLEPDKVGRSLAELATWRLGNPKSPPRLISIQPVFLDHGSTASIRAARAGRP